MSNVKDRATKLQDRLQYLQTNLNLKAVKLYSAAKYPASHIYKEYEMAIPPQSNGTNKIPRAYKCTVPLMDVPETHLSSNCKTEDGQYVGNNNLQEKLHFYHVRSKSNKEAYTNNSKESFPLHLSSINALLFNSMDNPYKISKKQASQKSNDKQKLEDAPDSIIQPWLSSELDAASSYLYTPTLGEASYSLYENFARIIVAMCIKLTFRIVNGSLLPHPEILAYSCTNKENEKSNQQIFAFRCRR